MANEDINDVSQGDLPVSVVERLVKYDEAKAIKNTAAAASSFDGEECDELACVDLLHRVWPDIAPPATPDSSITPKLLGDFRLLRELGRGGMGTVFEAEQISMGRHVALKVLPFAALARENSLQRFRNEVRAAAALNHPNIVPVYSIGEERGIHFYAMQLVRGRTLADMIDELRKTGRMTAGSEAPTVDSPGVIPAKTERDTQGRIGTIVDSKSKRSAETYRAAAHLGIQAADALQHAHDQGVLHRDIKPSNLMLDREGKLFVTDFGLARIEADAGMTMTGDILGTLRYMAPEQALAKRVVIDHRADIYSLGATLYELLTLQPVFGDTDRSELLKQIAFHDPRPLRKINSQIPGELETIILKSLAKNPDERYQTAQQLADDLRAYLEDRPIVAKPPTVLNRVAKWSRRHVAAVWAIVAVLAVTVTALAVSATLISSSLRNERAERQRAEKALLLARQAIRKSSSDLAHSLLDTPRAQAITTDFLTEGLGFYESLIKVFGNDPEVAADRARQLIVLSAHLEGTRQLEKARNLNQEADGILQKLIEQFPDNREYRRIRSSGRNSWAHQLARIGRVDESKQIAKEEIAFQRQEVALNPTALAEKDKLVTRLRYLAQYELKTGDFEEAIETADAAEVVCQELISKSPNDQALNWYRHQQAVILSLRGDALWKLGRLDEARETLRRSVEIQEQSLAEDPTSSIRSGWLASALINLESVLQKQDRNDEAREVLDSILQVAAASKSTYLRNAVAWQLATDLSEERRDGDRAVKIATEACTMTDYKDAGIVDTLAAAHAECGDFETAVKWSEKSLELAKDDSMRKTLASHLENFRNGRPWRE